MNLFDWYEPYFHLTQHKVYCFIIWHNICVAKFIHIYFLKQPLYEQEHVFTDEMLYI